MSNADSTDAVAASTGVGAVGVGGEPRVTAIGGGHGLARTLSAMRIRGWQPTAVVSVADDGGSSGRLRRDLGVSPPGDLRRALSTLCPDLAGRALLEYRFPTGELEGHALGNLVLLGAAAVRDGDQAAGLELLGELFDARGRVVPACDHGVDLEATLASGQVVHGQEQVTTTRGVVRVRLSGPAIANPVATAAIREADMVVVGPGSLFTSLVPPLLVDGIRDALLQARGTTVLVANIREQPGETTGMDLQAHVDAFFRHLPDDLGFDVMLVNDGEVDPAVVGTKSVLGTIDSHPRVDRVVAAAMADRDGGHDPSALAAVLAAL